jgi:hypothetical protein
MSRLVAAAFVLIVIASPIAAQSRVVIAGLFGDSDQVFPIVHIASERIDGDRWSAGVAGLSIYGSYEHPLSKRTFLGVEGDLSPFHAHNSNRIYVRGERDRSLEFDDRAAQVRLVVRRKSSEQIEHRLAFVVTSEDVDKVDAETERYWSSPYAGLDWRTTFRRVSAEDPLTGEAIGTTASIGAEVHAGEEVWSRYRVNATHGVQRGAWTGSVSATALGGNSLNQVNRWLVGGSWFLPGVETLHGFRYAEFRLDRAVTGGVAIGRQLGASRVTLRGNALRGDRETEAHAIALDVTRVTRGIRWQVGVAAPFQKDADRALLVYGRISAALFR